VELTLGTRKHRASVRTEISGSPHHAWVEPDIEIHRAAVLRAEGGKFAQLLPRDRTRHGADLPSQWILRPPTLTPGERQSGPKRLIRSTNFLGRNRWTTYVI